GRCGYRREPRSAQPGRIASSALIATVSRAAPVTELDLSPVGSWSTSRASAPTAAILPVSRPALVSRRTTPRSRAIPRSTEPRLRGGRRASSRGRARSESPALIAIDAEGPITLAQLASSRTSRQTHLPHRAGSRQILFWVDRDGAVAGGTETIGQGELGTFCARQLLGDSPYLLLLLMHEPPLQVLEDPVESHTSL